MLTESSDDMIYTNNYEIDESMGYDIDSDCEKDIDIHGKYCSTGACALWGIKLIIKDDNYVINLCDDSIVACATKSFLNDWTQIYGTTLVCHDNYHVSVDLNITFTNPLGYDIYSTFLSNYSDIIDICINSNGNSNSKSETGIANLAAKIDSRLKVCNSCHEWSSLNNTENEESNSALVINYNIAIVICVCLIILGSNL